MGLDIIAYSKLQHVGKHDKDPAKNEGEPGGINDWCYYDAHVQAFAYDSFPQSFRGIPVLGTNTSDGGATFIEGGCYEITPDTIEHSFRAGSYSGYGVWRADLQAQFNPARNPEGPFYELIWFADNEGSIGPDAARDLLADFRENADAYNPGRNYADYFREKYRDWTRACELAADGGLIDFH